MCPRGLHLAIPGHLLLDTVLILRNIKAQVWAMNKQPSSVYYASRGTHNTQKCYLLLTMQTTLELGGLLL